MVVSTAIHFPIQGATSQLVALAQPSPLSAAEEAHPAVQQLARRFNPAMALPIDDVWPVEVRYAWHDGSDLVARIEATGDAPAASWVAVPHRDLGRTDWSGLPHHAGDGRAIRYYLDAPGDDRIDGAGISGWRRRFRHIAQPAGPAAAPEESPYPPTQYAHLFWWNRARGLLAIQYWFFYPWNEWVNHHEADWEHITVVLEGSSASLEAAFQPLGHIYYLHDSWMEPPRLIREGAPAPGEDHPVVFVGGRGRMLAWSGPFSGASYPLPGHYRRAGFEPRMFAPDEHVSDPARLIAARDFQVIVLPEPARLDGRLHPELSWLRLPLHAGQRHVHLNPPWYRTLGRDHPPVQPGVRAGWLEAPRAPPYPTADLLASPSLPGEGILNAQWP